MRTTIVKLHQKCSKNTLHITNELASGISMIVRLFTSLALIGLLTVLLNEACSGLQISPTFTRRMGARDSKSLSQSFTDSLFLNLSLPPHLLYHAFLSSMLSKDGRGNQGRGCVTAPNWLKAAESHNIVLTIKAFAGSNPSLLPLL